MHQCVEHLLEDAPRAIGDHRQAGRHRHRVLVGQLYGALGDVGGEVADALQLVVDLDDGDDEAQVAGHRLVQRQQLEALLLDLDLDLVDLHVGGDHLARLRHVARLDRLHGEAQVLLDQRAESEDLALELLDLALQMSHLVLLPALSRSAR